MTLNEAASQLENFAVDYERQHGNMGPNDFWKDFTKYCEQNNLQSEDADVVLVLVMHMRRSTESLAFSDAYYALNDWQMTNDPRFNNAES